MISIKNVTKGYENGPIIEHINLDIEDGGCVVIIGGSGCGKSTLLRCINKLNVPEEGEIWIDGENILDPKADVDRIRRNMGMVYQHFNLFSHLNVLENIILAPTILNKTPREEAIAEAKQLLKRVGLAGKENNTPSSLSGGQKQRVAIARTLAMHPKVILFDEPTSALDPTMVDEVETVIKDLVNEGMTCVIVTHEMRFAKNVATKVIFLAEKGIYEQGTASEVFDHPKKPLTQRFLYRSRMYEASLLKDQLDLLSLNSELKKFVSKYETNPKQTKLFCYVCDELLYPIFHSEYAPAESADLKLICSENSEHHVLKISFPGLMNDPLCDAYIDELNYKLLEHYSEIILSKRSGANWEVSIQM
ncbi:MAG: amino acid ABC transporter ATP-binding protein [Erysipelotrichaceae bacterium]|nr:amino acid ABC transporter ATP-binding protein [Erysipelotrichaceae bacterium]